MKTIAASRSFIWSVILGVVLGLGSGILPLPAASLSLDPNFNAPFFAVPVLGSRGVLLPDGKYLSFFNQDTLADQSSGALMRFNSDGTFDTTFSFSRDYSGVTAAAPASGGKLIVAATKIIYGVPYSTQHQVYDILRLNPNGSIDSSFASAQTTDGGEVRIITVNADGTIFVGGRFREFNGQPNFGIVRLLGNGALDPSFASVTMTCATGSTDGNCGLWAAPVIDGDGKILVGGDFASIDGTEALGIARLNSDGTLDTTFTAAGFVPTGFFAGTPRPIRGIAVQSDHKIVAGGRFRVEASFAANPTGDIYFDLPVIRLNPNGTADDNYGYFGFLPQAGLIAIRNLIIQPDDKVIAIGRSLWRFSEVDGSLDPTFHNPALLIDQQFSAQFTNAEAFNIGITASGGFLIGGVFTEVDDAGGPPNGERWGIAKFHNDGSLDTTFLTSRREGYKIEPSSFARQGNGSAIIGFNSYGVDTFHSAIPHNLGRLTSAGTLDSAFDPIAALNPGGPLGPNFLPLGFTGLSDGSLLVSGISGNTANYGRLLADGSEDPAYHADPNVKFAHAFRRSDGKFVVSGFSTANLSVADPSAENAANGTQVQVINGDGSLDTSFHLDSSIVAATQQRDPDGQLLSIYLGSAILAVTADDKILFTFLSSDGSYHLVRLNPNGAIDPSFAGTTFPASVSFFILTFTDPQHPEDGLRNFRTYTADDAPVKQAKFVLDGKAVLMGSFNSYGATPAHGLLRINSDGSPDPTFNIGSGAQWTQTTETATFHPSIDNFEVGLDDKLLLAGTFESFNGTAAPGIISLNPDGTIDPSFVAPVKRQKYDYQPAYLARQGDGSFLLSGPYSRASDSISPSFFRLVLPPGATTPTGDSVTANEGSVGPATNLNTTFNHVGVAGTTSVSLIDPNWAGQLPPRYEIAGANLAFEVYTTASYSGPVTICFSLPSLDAGTFAAARVLHNAGNGLVDVTSSKDAATKTICASVNSLSPFVIAKLPYRATIQPPISADGSSVFNAKKGTVPVKFDLALGGKPTCTLPPATIAVTRIAGTNPSTIMLADGSNFRAEGCNYHYNLDSKGLGVGTYRVDIRINGTVIGNGIFQMK